MGGLLSVLIGSCTQHSDTVHLQPYKRVRAGGGGGRAGEKAQWLRELGALPEDQGSSPSNHMAAENNNSSSSESDTVVWPP